MKTKTKRSVVYHATPEKHWCFMAHSEVLNNKLNRGTITPEELEELAVIRANRKTQIVKAQPIGFEYTKDVTEKHPKTVEVILFGTFKQTVTWEEYQTKYKHLGF